MQGEGRAASREQTEFKIHRNIALIQAIVEKSPCI